MRSLYSNLVSYWPLHESSGNRVDLVGQTNNLSPTNTPTGNPGIIENATQFTAASSQYLTIASNSNVQTGDIDFTLTAWVYMDSKPANLMEIVSKYAATAGNAEYLLYWDNAADRLNFACYRATDSLKTVAASSFGAPSLSTWYFVCGWHDANADTVNIEINTGVSDSVATTGALQAAGTANFSIGALGTVGSQYFNGRICEVGFWKRVLTRQERTWLYNNKGGRTYPFDWRLTAEGAIGRDVNNRRNRRLGMIS